MLHAADVAAIQELKKKAEEEAVKRRELEIQVTKASSILQEKVAAWNMVERQLKVGRPQLKILTLSTASMFQECVLVQSGWLPLYLQRNPWLIFASCHLCQGGYVSCLFEITQKGMNQFECKFQKMLRMAQGTDYIFMVSWISDFFELPTIKPKGL